jgi:ATP-dependent RNA helicase DeaD
MKGIAKLMTQNFSEMNLSPDILKAIEDMGFEEATPIQSQSIELILTGEDIIGQSQTGTGKTAAFGIPILEKIDPKNSKLQALILSPTRELAIQISEEFRRLLKYRDSIKVLPVYGGQPIDRQIMALKKGVQVVIGTPGRVMDHMERRTIKLDGITTVVLDEADEMLDMGFREDIENIVSQTPDERQTIMFSATMPKEILALTKKYQTDPKHVQVVHKEMTVPLIDQYYYEVRESTKLEALCRLIDMLNPELSLVFCNTKRKVDQLVEQLQGRGYFAEALHGDLKQTQRDTVMKKFRNHTLEVLVATDVAARGIDVDNIEIVFNYDIPQDAEYYVHRIGRTARAGKSGMSCTFVVGKEIYKLRDIMRFTKAKIEKKNPPSLSDIEETKAKSFIEKIKETIEEGKLAKYSAIVERISSSEDYSTMDIASALLKLQLFDKDAEEVDFGESYDSFERRKKKQLEKRDGKDGKDGKDKESKKSLNLPPDKIARLFITVGTKDKVRVKDIVGALANETGIPGKAIGNVDIFEEFSFVDIPKDLVKVVTNAKGIRIKGVKVSIERAKRR